MPRTTSRQEAASQTCLATFRLPPMTPSKVSTVWQIQVTKRLQYLANKLDVMGLDVMSGIEDIKDVLQESVSQNHREVHNRNNESPTGLPASDQHPQGKTNIKQMSSNSGENQFQANVHTEHANVSNADVSKSIVDVADDKASKEPAVRSSNQKEDDHVTWHSKNSAVQYAQPKNTKRTSYPEDDEQISNKSVSSVGIPTTGTSTCQMKSPFVKTSLSHDLSKTNTDGDKTRQSQLDNAKASAKCQTQQKHKTESCQTPCGSGRVVATTEPKSTAESASVFEKAPTPSVSGYHQPAELFQSVGDIYQEMYASSDAEDSNESEPFAEVLRIKTENSPYFEHALPTHYLQSEATTATCGGDVKCAPAGSFFLGGTNILMQINDYQECVRKSKDGKGLVLKMMDYLFTKMELATSNLSGKTKDPVSRQPQPCHVLDNGKINALFKQARQEYPGFLEDMDELKQLRVAVNTKCRHTRLNVTQYM